MKSIAKLNCLEKEGEIFLLLTCVRMYILLWLLSQIVLKMYRISSEIFNPVIAKLYNYTAEGIDDTEWPLSHTYFLEALRKRDIFLAYQVSLNLIPVKKFESFLGHTQYTPDAIKTNSGFEN